MRACWVTADGDIWVLLDDRAGNRSQALGVAERLGHGFREMEIRYAVMANLPNAMLGASVSGLDKDSKAALHAPWPKLVIAAGRRTAPVARWIKKQSGDETRIVQVMDPGSGDAAFDLICRPAHDTGIKTGPNILTISAAPHRIGAEMLDAALDDAARVPAGGAAAGAAGNGFGDEEALWADARRGDAEGGHRLSNDVLAEHRAHAGFPIAAPGEDRRARALELNVAVRAVDVHDLADHHGAAVSQRPRLLVPLRVARQRVDAPEEEPRVLEEPL